MEQSSSNVSYEKLIQDYISKQRRFKYLVKQIQKAIESCEYKRHGYSLNEFTKKNWNISQIEAYRYIIAAKVMDQLQEFEIQPNYVNLCKSLYNYAKTPEQLKLLWKTLLNKAKGRPYYINSSHVSKTWKELYQDKKYTHICHYEESIAPLGPSVSPSTMPIRSSTSTQGISPLISSVSPSTVPLTTPGNTTLMPSVSPSTIPMGHSTVAQGITPLISSVSPSTIPITTPGNTPLMPSVSPSNIPMGHSAVTQGFTPLISSVSPSAVPITTPGISPLAPSVPSSTVPIASSTNAQGISTLVSSIPQPSSTVSSVPNAILFTTSDPTISLPATSINGLNQMENVTIEVYFSLLINQ
ncbi:hypothetical protein H8356DRAFT_1309411 [Neocallimastix lanati (nom. inval.)]|nr:hypothetical protein H8356DRAFT_1309411 [Neocallimastix sp. JGI-2020a]